MQGEQVVAHIGEHVLSHRGGELNQLACVTDWLANLLLVRPGVLLGG
jgi:hypothetical protein